jgi:hypothetical protein
MSDEATRDLLVPRPGCAWNWWLRGALPTEGLEGWMLGAEDDLTSLPIAHNPPLRYPSERFRSVCAWVVNRAVVRSDGHLERGGAARRLTDLAVGRLYGWVSVALGVTAA